jgi:hypothetical protein
MTGEKLPAKKEMILSAARKLGKTVYTPAEIEQIRRKLIAEWGEAAKASADYIADVLAEAKIRVVMSVHVDPQGQYEEELQDLLHFATLEEAEVCLVRLDELLRKFETEGQRAGETRVLEIARLGRRRAQMIAHNHKVDATKRREKEEVARWFSIWLEQPDAFFDWLEIRKQSPEFRASFPQEAKSE